MLLFHRFIWNDCLCLIQLLYLVIFLSCRHLSFRLRSYSSGYHHQIIILRSFVLNLVGICLLVMWVHMQLVTVLLLCDLVLCLSSSRAVSLSGYEGKLELLNVCLAPLLTEASLSPAVHNFTSLGSYQFNFPTSFILYLDCVVSL